MTNPAWMSWLKDRHYEKAPIREAIIDVQVKPSSPLEPAAFENPPSLLALGYSGRQKVMVNQVRGQLDEGVLTATASQDSMGYAFQSFDGKHVVQFRVNGFTFSRLAPYVSWQQLRDEASKIWSVYRSVVGDLRVIRVGLRYVNQLDLPMPIRDLRDYIRVYPEISSDLSQQLGGFFMQIQIPQQDLSAMLILNEAMVPPSGPEVVSIVLDIDLFKLDLEVDLDNEIWSILELFRVRKNLIFEGCITNTTRELIS